MNMYHGQWVATIASATATMKPVLNGLVSEL